MIRLVPELFATFLHLLRQWRGRKSFGHWRCLLSKSWSFRTLYLFRTSDFCRVFSVRPDYAWNRTSRVGRSIVQSLAAVTGFSLADFFRPSSLHSRLGTCFSCHSYWSLSKRLAPRDCRLNLAGDRRTASYRAKIVSGQPIESPCSILYEQQRSKFCPSRILWVALLAFLLLCQKSLERMMSAWQLYSSVHERFLTQQKYQFADSF